MSNGVPAGRGDTGAPAQRRIAAVLFDMDGTLLDSEPTYWASDRAFLSPYGIDYTKELNESFTGRGSLEMMRELGSMYPDSPLNGLPVGERVRLKDEAYALFALSRVKPFPASVALARLLAARGVPLAIASGSSPDVIDAMLDANGLGDLFAVRVSSAEVPRGKPAPDVFIEAAGRCGIRAEDCLVLEDSRSGVAAAKAAGMACVALPFLGAERLEDFASADIVVHGGAAELDPEVVLSAFGWIVKE